MLGSLRVIVIEMATHSSLSPITLPRPFPPTPIARTLASRWEMGLFSAGHKPTINPLPHAEPQIRVMGYITAINLLPLCNPLSSGRGSGRWLSEDPSFWEFTFLSSLLLSSGLLELRSFSVLRPGPETVEIFIVLLIIYRPVLFVCPLRNYEYFS